MFGQRGTWKNGGVPEAPIPIERPTESVQLPRSIDWRGHVDHCTERTPVNHRTVQRPVAGETWLRICDGGPQCLPLVTLAVSGREGRADARPLRHARGRKGLFRNFISVKVLE